MALTLSTKLSDGIFLLEGIVSTIKPLDLIFSHEDVGDIKTSITVLLLRFSQIDGQNQWVGVSQPLFLEDLFDNQTQKDLPSGKTARKSTVAGRAKKILCTLRDAGLVEFLAHNDQIVLCPTDRLIENTHRPQQLVEARIAWHKFD